MFLSAFKILILLPDVFVYEMNWLFWSLALNSLLAITLGYILQTRTATALGIRPAVKSYMSWWYALKMVALLFCASTPAFDFLKIEGLNNHHLICQPILYRK